MAIKDIKKTITSIFMIPTLGINRDHLINNQMINGYSWDINKDIQYENSVYLLFKPSNLNKFKDFLDEEYERDNTLIEDYNYDDFVVVVYSLNPAFKDDFDLIKQGKYSKTSETFQKQFPETFIVNVGTIKKRETSLQYRIFKKTDDLKQYWKDKAAFTIEGDMEVWDTWCDEKETLDILKIKAII